MWNMTTYKGKLKKVGKSVKHTFLLPNIMFALKTSTNTKTSLGSAQKIGVRTVSGNNQFFTPNRKILC